MPRIVTPPDEEKKSKSQVKRELEALQKLGESFAKLPEKTLARARLPEDVLEAVAAYRSMKSFGAQRRQLQLIGRKMAGLDFAEVSAELERLNGEGARYNERLHRTERLREAILDDDGALTAFVAEHPGQDVQKLRQAVRAARREKQAGQPPKAYRELYRMLAQILEDRQD